MFEFGVGGLGLWGLAFVGVYRLSVRFEGFDLVDLLERILNFSYGHVGYVVASDRSSDTL